MILGNKISKILKTATEYQSEMTDGVVQYDYETGKLFGAGFTTGTLENPANPFIEVYRLPQGERGEIDCKCYENDDCPFWDDYFGGHFDEDIVDEWGDTRIECCIGAFADDVDEEVIRESVEEQVRNILSEHLGGTISKLNEIRIAISDIKTPYRYVDVRAENWEMDVLDVYVDSAIEHGFRLDIEPLDWLDAEVQNLANVRFSEDDVEFWGEVGCLIEDHNLDGALKMLQ